MRYLNNPLELVSEPACLTYEVAVKSQDRYCEFIDLRHFCYACLRNFLLNCSISEGCTPSLMLADYVFAIASRHRARILCILENDYSYSRYKVVTIYDPFVIYRVISVSCHVVSSFDLFEDDFNAGYSIFMHLRDVNGL